MKKKEEAIRKICGGDNPFKVPEGYFQNFTRNLMDKIPERQAIEVVAIRKKPVHRLRTIWYAAASFTAVAILGCALYLSLTPSADTFSMNEALMEGSSSFASLFYDEEQIEEALDYALVNNEDIIYYLSEAN